VGAKNEAEATRLKAATDAEANAGRDKCISRPGSGGEFLADLAAIREVLACAGGHVAAVERILERKGLVAAAAAGKGPTAEENLAEASGLREFIAGLELSSRYGSLENVGSTSKVWVWNQSTELDKKSYDAAAAATARWAGEGLPSGVMVYLRVLERAGRSDCRRPCASFPSSQGPTAMPV
jgi:hypothetical protein